MGAVFYLGADWPQWKPLGIPGTHLPLKRGSWLMEFKRHEFISFMMIMMMMILMMTMMMMMMMMMIMMMMIMMI